MFVTMPRGIPAGGEDAVGRARADRSGIVFKPKVTIEYKSGSFLDGPERYIAHGVNMKGRFGKGAALAIRQKYPSAYQYYMKAFVAGELVLGNIVRTVISSAESKYQVGSLYIFSLVTQENYGNEPGRVYFDYEALEECLVGLNYFVSPTSKVAMPKIRAGLAGGNWDRIADIIEGTANFQPVVYQLEGV